MPDTRFVYGALCLFMAPIQLAGKTPSGLPCCPHCGGVLYECDSKDEFMKGANDYAKGHPGYLKMLAWAEGKCFKTFDDLITAYIQK